MKTSILLSALSGFLFFPELPADTPASPYGVCAHICKENQWKLAEQKFRILKPANVRWVRNGFTWAQIEPKPGVRDFAALDAVAASAKKNGIDILPILAVPPVWRRPVVKHLGAWREYVRETVSRYGTQFRFWEIWNEQNWEEYPGNSLSPEDYVKVLKAAREEIRKVDPGIRVVFGGTAGVPLDYIDRCLKLGAAESFDVMNIHPYADRRIPESVDSSVRAVFALLAKHKADKPVWVTEFSWATHRFPSAMSPEVLKASLKIFGLDPETSPVAVIRNPDLENYRGKEFAPEDYTAGNFRNRSEIGYADLKNLDVKKYPVLVPTLTQAFPRKYYSDLVSYVRRGGVVIHSFGLPFYCDGEQDSSGVWQQIHNPDMEMLKRLHIHYLTSWTDKIPVGGRIVPAEASGLSPSVFRGEKNGERCLSGKNLKEGDKFIPFYLQKKGTAFLPVIGVYRFASDLKGGFIADVTFPAGGVSQEDQGKFLPRAYLGFLANGVSKIFWYKFRAEEFDPTCNGHHFGIVHRDFSPREAFTALRFLISMCPEGSSKVILSEQGKLRHAFWKQPGGAKIHAYWTLSGTEEVKIPFPVRAAYSHLGNVRTVPQTLEASGSIVYLIEK